LGNKISTINYLNGDSLQSKISTPFIEGLIKTSVNFEDANEGEENYTISNNYAINRMKSVSEDNYEKIMNLYSPLEYKVLNTDFLEVDSFVPMEANKYSLGIASNIQTNANHDIYRFNLSNTK